MNADEITPFRLAHLLRNLAQACEKNHLIADAGPLHEIDAAIWFEQLRNGNLRCDFQPASGLPPCTADGLVAVSNPTETHDQIFICCLEHLPHFLVPGQSRSASVLQPQSHATLLRLLPPGRPAPAPPFARPRPLRGQADQRPLQAASARIGDFVAPCVAVEILSRKDDHGNPMFPILSQHIDA